MHGPFLGYIIQNLSIEDVLDEELNATPIATILQNAKIRSIDTSDTMSQLLSFTVEAGSKQEILSTSLLLGCDGNNSFVRQSLSPIHFPYHLEDYMSFGVVSTFTTTSSIGKRVDGTAYQRYLPSGPLAALPLAPNVYSLVWSIPNAWRSSPIFKDKEKFAKLLNLAFYGPHSEISRSFSSSLPCTTFDANYLGETDIYDDFGTIIDASEPEFFPLKSGIVASSMSISNKNLRVLLMGYFVLVFSYYA